jgi:hypothetical protein
MFILSIFRFLLPFLLPSIPLTALRQLVVGHKVDPRETAKKTAVKGPNKKKKRTGARNVSKLTNVHLLEKVCLLCPTFIVLLSDCVMQGIDLSKDYVPE